MFFRNRSGCRFVTDGFKGKTVGQMHIWLTQPCMTLEDVKVIDRQTGRPVRLAGASSRFVLMDEADPMRVVATYSSDEGERLTVSPHDRIGLVLYRDELLDLEVDDFVYLWMIAGRPMLQGTIRLY